MEKRYPFKQALVTGIVSALFATVFFSFIIWLRGHFNWQINPATIRWSIGLFTLIILAIGIYAGMQNIKKANGGKLSYGRAIIAGILVGLTVGVVMAILGFIYTQYVNPGYASYMVDEGLKAMRNGGHSPAEIAAAKADLQKQFAPSTQVTQALIGQTVMGTIFSLIIGAFARTKNS